MERRDGMEGDHGGHISKKKDCSQWEEAAEHFPFGLLIDFFVPGLYLSIMERDENGVIGVHHSEPLHCAERANVAAVTKRYFLRAAGNRTEVPFYRGFAANTRIGLAR
jgi:hypothetical protein